MTVIHDSVRVGRWVERFRRMRLVLTATAIAFAGLWLFGATAALPALAGFVLVALAALIASARGDIAPAAMARDEPRAPRVGDPLIEAVLAGLPDPVVALDRRGDVVALNARAIAVAPALRPGEPVSLGLRVPQVLEAIRRARASGTAQRVEFSERVPLDRWYEVIVTPISSPGVAANPGLVLLAFHDLTPLRRVEEMRADFVANASHELRTPLAALSGFIDTLRGSAREDPAARERFLPIMQAQGSGAIVNNATVEAMRGIPYNSVYSAFNAGVIAFTKSMAVELGRTGITVNCICPGPIDTGMTAGIDADAKAIYARRRVPLRRYGQPEEVAQMTLNLCLPSASFVNGTAIPVDGGMSIRHT